MQNAASYGQLAILKTIECYVSIAERTKMEELITEMENIIADVNVAEIADHINEESLWNWCGAWREKAAEILNEMRSETGMPL